MARVERSPGYQAVSEVCAALGVPFEVVRGGKHPKAIFTVQGREFRVIISGTPSDFRTYYNCKSFILRTLRRANIVPPAKV